MFIRTMGAVAVVAALAMPAAGSSVLVPLVANQSSGSLTTANGSLVSHNGLEYQLDWSVVLGNDGWYTYTYKLLAENGSLFGGDGDGTSHMIIETSLKFDADVNLDTAHKFEGEATFVQGPSNPGLPGNLFGIKLDVEKITYTLKSDKVPVWGDIYGKKRSNQAIWNSGFGTDPANPQAGFAGWVATPDTDTVPPPPGTVPTPTAGLAGLGLMGLLAMRRRARLN